MKKMNKIITRMKMRLVFITIILCALNVSAKVHSLNGSGTANDPYLIISINDLKWMRDRVNIGDIDYSTAYYKLISNLDFSCEDDWEPIGLDYFYSFKGYFDGNKKVISNIRIGKKDSPSNYYFNGFFGFIQNSSITNLGVRWLGIYSENIVGGIIARADESDISNCFSSGEFSSVDAMPGGAGGIVGESIFANIVNCYSEGRIISSSLGTSSYSGGIVASAHDTNISNCYSIGDITSSAAATSYSGGIAGDLNGGRVSNCYSTGTISSNSNGRSYSAGIVGYLRTGNIENSVVLNDIIYSISQILDFCFVGRIVGNEINTLIKNYASTDLITAIGTSPNQLHINTSFTGSNNGENLRERPIDILNNYVENNRFDLGVLMRLWESHNYVNNGYPVFGELAKLKIAFETYNGTIIEPIQIKYGELLPKPTNPVRDGYEFSGWHKDQELNQPWDFDNDRVYSNTTLYAKWNSATSIEDMNSDGIVVYSGNRCVVVKNATSPITVYNVGGAALRTIQQPSEVESLDIEPGYYIVKTGRESSKVMVY